MSLFTTGDKLTFTIARIGISARNTPPTSKFEGALKENVSLKGGPYQGGQPKTR